MKVELQATVFDNADNNGDPTDFDTLDEQRVTLERLEVPEGTVPKICIALPTTGRDDDYDLEIVADAQELLRSIWTLFAPGPLEHQATRDALGREWQRKYD